MKVIKIVNVVLNTLLLFLVLTMVSMIYSITVYGSNATIITCLVIIGVLVLILYFATSSRDEVDTVEKCKKLYSDVSHISRKGLFVISVFTALFIALLFVVSMENKLDLTYPDAETFLKEDMNVSDNTLLLAKSLPNWVTERLYVRGQALYDAYAVESDDSKSEEVKLQEVDAIADDMDKAIGSQNMDAILAVFILVVLGILRTYSVRCAQYHRTMRELEGGNK